MTVTCTKCGTVSKIPAKSVPLGKSYIQCPSCKSRIDIVRGVKQGSTLQNLVGVRYMGAADDLSEQFSDPGDLWRVVEVIEPCPEKGKGRACEVENNGRCPNQRLVLRMRGAKSLYRSCLYRKGRKIFDKSNRLPVGETPTSSDVNPKPKEKNNDQS